MQPDQNQPRGPYAPDAGAQANWPPNSVPGQGFGTVPPQGWPQEQQAWPQGQPYPPYTPEQLQQMQYEAYMQQMPEMPTAQQPQQEPPRKKRKKKKQGGGSGGAVWKTLIALVLIGGAAWYFLKDMLVDTRQSTAVIEMGTLGTSYTGDALIVRNETAYDEEGVQYIDYVAQEGSVVYRGEVVCYVYSTGYSSKEMTA